MRFTRALTGFLTTVLVGGIVVGVCFAALIPSIGVVTSATEYTMDLPTDLSKLSQRSSVYAATGEQIGVLGSQDRQNVTLDQVPQVVIDAVVATEDKTFWKNDGIDLSAVARAALKNLTSGEIEQGGSTISQQLVKNRILSPKRDLNRKIREILLAIELNKDYSKREILEQYLNTVYFGQGAYGISSAAERLLLRADPSQPFGIKVTPLKDVTVGQAAMLAGLIQSPENYNPIIHPDRARERRTLVLALMVKEGYITRDQEAAANAEPIDFLRPADDLRPRDSWVEEVQDRLLTDPRYAVLGADRAAREAAVLKGGLKIYTTADPVAQANAQEAVNNSFNKPGFSGSIVAIDPRTGAVRAMVAGEGFENSQYNIATTTPGRQAGSTWKIITLATAMQNHYSANDRVNGTSPCDFGRLGATANAEPGGGTMTLRAATSGSVNCAFVNVQLSLGFPKIIDMAKKLGITQDTLAGYLTLTLGTIESTPLEMATVASSVANVGMRHDPYFVEKIVNSDGITIYQEQHPGVRVLDEDAAACTIDLLRGVVTGGTGTGAAVPGWEVIGKTGTTDGHGNAWFVGMTPTLVAAVWHGRPDSNVGDAGFGGQIPASIFKRFMTAQLATDTPQGWPAPPSWCNAPGQSLTPAGRSAAPPPQATPATPQAPTVQVNPPPTAAPTPQPTTPVQTTPPATVKPAGDPGSGGGQGPDGQGSPGPG
jgi:membrane peptidoglycan carboxypeptidase